MSAPFQFSVGRMLAAVVLLAVAIRLGMLFLAIRFDGNVWPPLVFIGVFSAGGAAIGCIAGETKKGAIYGTLVAAFFVLITLLAPTESAVSE